MPTFLDECCDDDCQREQCEQLYEDFENSCDITIDPPIETLCNHAQDRSCFLAANIAAQGCEASCNNQGGMELECGYDVVSHDDYCTGMIKGTDYKCDIPLSSTKGGGGDDGGSCG